MQAQSRTSLTPLYDVISMTVIKIDKYVSEIEHGKIVFYAVKGKTKYPMPEAYKDMYTDDYLAIEERTLNFPELFDTASTHYIPRRTGGISQ